MRKLILLWNVEGILWSLLVSVLLEHVMFIKRLFLFFCNVQSSTGILSLFLSSSFYACVWVCVLGVLTQREDARGRRRASELQMHQDFKRQCGAQSCWFPSPSFRVQLTVNLWVWHANCSSISSLAPVFVEAETRAMCTRLTFFFFLFHVALIT